MRLCEYGCGQKAIHQFKNGKWCCSNYISQCPIITKKRSKSLIGHIVTKETIQKIKQGRIGFKHTKETKKLISETGKGRVPWNKNIKNCFTKKTLNQMKQSHIGQKAWNKNKNLISINRIKKCYPTFSKIEELRYNPDKPGEKEIQVHCKNHLCKNSKEKSGWFTPNTIGHRIDAVEKYNDGNYFYCCDECKQECPLFNLRSDPNFIKIKLYTSEEYQTWRTTVLKREDYKCEYCEEKATDVHHSRPQKLEPGFVLDPDFGVACCEKCHYKYGHKEECSTGNLANKICK